LFLLLIDIFLEVFFLSFAVILNLFSLIRLLIDQYLKLLVNPFLFFKFFKAFSEVVSQLIILLFNFFCVF